MSDPALGAPGVQRQELSPASWVPVPLRFQLHGLWSSPLPPGQAGVEVGGLSTGSEGQQPRCPSSRVRDPNT